MMQGAALLCIYKVKPYMTQVDNNSINEQCQSNRHQMAVILWHKSQLFCCMRLARRLQWIRIVFFIKWFAFYLFYLSCRLGCICQKLFLQTCLSVSMSGALYSLVPSSIFPPLTPQAKCAVPILINLVVFLLLTPGQNHLKLHSLLLNQVEETKIWSCKEEKVRLGKTNCQLEEKDCHDWWSRGK